MTQERRSCLAKAVEIRAVEGRQPILAGWPVVYNERSELLYGQFIEIIAPGAFDRWLDTDPDMLALVEHDRDRVLGRRSSGTLRVARQKSGLEIEVDQPDTSYGRDLAVSVRRQDIKGMSFGFKANKDAWTQVNGRAQRTVLEAEIYEVSFTAFPAYTVSEASVRSLQDWLAGAGTRRRRLHLAEIS